jgi:hypothetical protein
VIDIATKLGIQVVAEGIEAADQAQILQSLGCVLGQGYLYSHAVDCDAMTALLRGGPLRTLPAPRCSSRPDPSIARAGGARWLCPGCPEQRHVGPMGPGNHGRLLSQPDQTRAARIERGPGADRRAGGMPLRAKARARRPWCLPAPGPPAATPASRGTC